MNTSGVRCVPMRHCQKRDRTNEVLVNGRIHTRLNTYVNSDAVLSVSKLYHRLAHAMASREPDPVDTARWELVMDDLVNQRVDQQVNRSVLIN